MKTRDIITPGSLDIGWVDQDFTAAFGERSIGVKAFSNACPPFKVLPRDMSDEEIRSELGVTDSTLKDVVAFLKEPHEGTKDGYANIFYVGGLVVGVFWYCDDREWHVCAWPFGGRWFRGGRGFSGSGFETQLETSEPQSFALPPELVINGVTYKRV